MIFVTIFGHMERTTAKRQGGMSLQNESYVQRRAETVMIICLLVLIAILFLEAVGLDCIFMIRKHNRIALLFIKQYNLANFSRSINITLQVIFHCWWTYNGLFNKVSLLMVFRPPISLFLQCTTFKKYLHTYHLPINSLSKIAGSKYIFIQNCLHIDMLPSRTMILIYTFTSRDWEVVFSPNYYQL